MRILGDARNRRIFGGLFFLPRRFELLRFAQPQLCCVPDIGQAARSAVVCKPTRLTDGRIPYAYGKRSNPMRIWHYCWEIATGFGSCEVQTSKHPRCKTPGTAEFSAVYFFCPEDSNCCALLNHNYVVSLTLVRLHARLLCASPPASLTDESLMLCQVSGLGK